MELIVLLPVLAFAALQGAVVFATAHWLVRRLGRQGWLAKAAAMAASYVAWIAFTVGAYAWMGGEGGLMDGFGLLLFLCFTALVSSVVYLLAWVVAGSGREPTAPD